MPEKVIVRCDFFQRLGTSSFTIHIGDRKVKLPPELVYDYASAPPGGKMYVTIPRWLAEEKDIETEIEAVIP
jgi:hypothetical protein